MLRNIIAAALVVAMVAPVAAKEINYMELKRYGVEKAKVVYQVTGMSEGTEELWFDTYGMRERKQTTTNTMGITTNAMSILNGPDSYHVDMNGKTATRTDTPLLKQAAETHGEKDLHKISMDALKAGGAKIIGKETVLGKECEVWQTGGQMGATLWLWNGLMLRTVTKLGNTEMRIEATSIDTKVNFSDADFYPPEGYEVSEGGNAMQKLEQYKQMMKKN